MPTLVFLPWISIADPVNLGRFRLSRYEPRATWSDDVHRILRAYEGMPGRPVDKAIVVSVDGVVGGDLADSDVEDVFDLRRAVSFAGLRQRRFFHHTGYVNDHSFACVVQNFQPGHEGVGVSSRRRDGSNSSLWSEGRRVARPDHVPVRTEVTIDARLVDALRTSMQATDGDALRDAVELFNLANTDSADLRPHTELLLSVAAAQRMLGVEKRSDTKIIAQRFAEALSGIEPEPVLSDSRRTIPSGRKASTLRELWFEDFYASRGVIAHGRPGGPPKPIWNLAEHLLLSAYIIPRLALLRLAESGFYSLTEQDRSEIADFDHLLCPTTLFGPPDATDDDENGEDFHPASGPWAWTDALLEAAGERHRKKHRPDLERALMALLADEGVPIVSETTHSAPKADAALTENASHDGAEGGGTPPGQKTEPTEEH